MKISQPALLPSLIGVAKLLYFLFLESSFLPPRPEPTTKMKRFESKIYNYVDQQVKADGGYNSGTGWGSKI